MYMTKGNLLTANSYAVSAGQKSVTLTDYETNTPVEIQLDETLSVIDNAKRYFALYNKTKKAYQVAQEMSEQTKEEIDYLNQLLFDIDICDNFEELKEIAQEFEPPQKIDKKKKEENIKLTKEEIDGFTVYIGKNNKQNDYLYSKISSGDDVWFHVLNTPGSHVIAKTGSSSQQLKDETVLKIAKLAKQYSTAKNSTKAAVVYTLRKYIKRPNNTKSGFVVYKNETEIVVD